MERPSIASGPKVSQIANLFQRRTSESDGEEKNATSTSQVTRSESHTTRFHNARALFEKLGVESHLPSRPAALSLRNSNSREDNLCGAADEPTDGDRTPSPKRNKYPVSNGMAAAKRDPTKIHNTSRLKAEKPEKPEKPERKFNSKELIEKQKNWTSHFTKTRPTRFNSDPNRCDIIRAVPNAIHYPGQQDASQTSASLPPMQQQQQHPVTAIPPSIPSTATSTPIPIPPPSSSPRDQPQLPRHSRSIDPTTGQPKIPPSPPVRHVSLTSASTNYNVPDVKPRQTSRSNSVPNQTSSSPLPPPRPLPSSPNKTVEVATAVATAAAPAAVIKPAPAFDAPPQQKRKRSIEFVDTDVVSSPPPPPPVEYAQVKKHSVDLANSTPSPALSASSPQSSPSHTEDEKQEIESNEKTDLYDEIIMECKYLTHSSQQYIYIILNSLSGWIIVKKNYMYQSRQHNGKINQSSKRIIIISQNINLVKHKIPFLLMIHFRKCCVIISSDLYSLFFSIIIISPKRAQ